MVLSRAGLIDLGLAPGLLRGLAWALVGFMALNTVGNLAGQHPIERFGMGGVTAGCAVLIAVVAAG